MLTLDSDRNGIEHWPLLKKPTTTRDSTLSTQGNEPSELLTKNTTALLEHSETRGGSKMPVSKGSFVLLTTPQKIESGLLPAPITRPKTTLPEMLPKLSI